MTTAQLRRRIASTQGRIGRARGDHTRRELYARLAQLRDQLAAAETADTEQEAWT